MSTVISQQPPKEDEEEEDEEQGEEFVFEDSAEEDKLQADSKGISSVQRSTQEDSGTGSQDTSQLPKSSPPAGQEDVPNKDVASTSTEGNGCLFCRQVTVVRGVWTHPHGSHKESLPLYLHH